MSVGWTLSVRLYFTHGIHRVSARERVRSRNKTLLLPGRYAQPLLDLSALFFSIVNERR